MEIDIDYLGSVIEGAIANGIRDGFSGLPGTEEIESVKAEREEARMLLYRFADVHSWERTLVLRDEARKLLNG